jgi:hypothetical protein
MPNQETMVRENQRGNHECSIKRQWLEKTKGAITNAQSRDNGNIGHTRQRMKTKQNPKTQHRDEKHRPHQKPGVNTYM